MARRWKSKRSEADREAAKAQSEERKSEADNVINGAIERIADLTDEARSNESFREWLDWQGKFHKYSWRNSVWLMIQAEKRARNVSQFAGYRAWNKLGRQVRKGEKAFNVFAPCRYKRKDEATGEESYGIRGFRVESTFDIGQTERICEACEGNRKAHPDCRRCKGTGYDPEDARPAAPEYRTPGEDHGDAWGRLAAFADTKGIAVEMVDRIAGGAKGCSYGGRVEVLATMSGAERAATLAHEIAHELLHWTDDAKLIPDHTRSTQEIEAEGTSYVVMTSFGIDAEKSSFYLASWGGDGDKVRASLGRIAKAAKEIIEGAAVKVEVEVEAEAAAA